MQNISNGYKTSSDPNLVLLKDLKKITILD